MLRLTTLGPTSSRLDGTELKHFAAHKQKFALLVYIAVEGPVSRDRVISLFWPEREEERARHSLSQVLYALRREFGDKCFRFEGESLGVELEQVVIDALEFEAAARQGAWDRAVESYQGLFLEQFYLPRTREFNEWLDNYRTRLGRLANKAFSRAVQAQRDLGDIDDAAAIAGRWVGLAPLEDEAQHAHIALLAQLGRRNEALRHYDGYRDRLARELQVEPLEETVELVEQIRAGKTINFRPLDGAGVETGTLEDDAGSDLPAVDPSDRVSERSPNESKLSWAKFVNDLRSRHLLKVAIAYLAFGAVLLEVVDTLIDNGMLWAGLFAPLVVTLAVGLPLVLFIAWVRESPASFERYPSKRWPRWLANIRTSYIVAFLSVFAIALLFRFLPPRTDGPMLLSESAIYPATEIAVLYLEDNSEGGKNAHLARAFTTALITRLADVDTLGVRSASALKSVESGVSLQELVQRLEVGTVLEGDMVAAGDSLRITIQLLDARDLTQFASVVVHGSRTDPFNLLDDLAMRTAEALREKLGVEILVRELRAGTSSVEAWDNVQRSHHLRDQAQNLWESGDSAAALEALDQADLLLQRAELLDPDWLEPLLQRGWVAATRARQLGGPRYRDIEIRSASAGLGIANRALAVGPESPDAFELRGVLHMFLWESAGASADDTLLIAAESDLRAAISLEPNRVRALNYLARILQETSRFDEAKLMAHRAYEADAFFSEGIRPVFRLCYLYYQLEELEAASAWCREANRRHPGTTSILEIELQLLASPLGDTPNIERAWRLAREREASYPPQGREDIRAVGLMYVAAVIARAGMKDSAGSVIAAARAADLNNEPLVDYNEANVRQHLGETEKAIRLLELYLRADPKWRVVLPTDWYFKDLWDHPDYRRLWEQPG